MPLTLREKLIGSIAIEQDRQRSLFDVPAQRHSETSVAAAESIAPHVADAEALVLAILREAPEGLCDNEIIERAVARGGSFNGPRARRISLTRKGLVVDSGETRVGKSGMPSTVWRAKPSNS